MVRVYQCIAACAGLFAWGSELYSQNWESDPLSGNWHVEAGKYGEGQFSLHRPATTVCLHQETGGCLFEWQYDYTENQMVVQTRLGRLTDHATVIAQSTTDRSLSLLRGSTWPHTKVDLVASGEGEFEGVWERGDQRGPELWRRLEPKVDFIGASLIGGDTYAPLEKWYRTDEIVTINSADPYNPNDWPAENNMRGNRPGFRLFIAGEHFWGFQEVSFPDAVDYEIFSRGNLAPFANSNPNDAPPGRLFNVYLWANATPGLKTLRINGEDFKVNIVIPGFPEPILPTSLGSVHVSLGFTGVALDDAVVPVSLGFTGIGLSQAPIAAALSFQGLGLASNVVSAELSFTGLGWQGTAVETSIGFQGLGADTAAVPVSLAFAGLSLADHSPSVSVEFSGLALGESGVSTEVAFAGFGSPSTPPPISIAFSGLAGGANSASVSLLFQGLSD